MSFIVKPPCVQTLPSGLKIHYIWESTLNPQNDTSDALIEIWEHPSGAFSFYESPLTKQADISL